MMHRIVNGRHSGGSLRYAHRHLTSLQEQNSQGFEFTILNEGKADKQRLGELKTPHGSIMTPAFVFCATKAAMKGITPQTLVDEDTQIILSNTYHLMLNPGADLIDRLGGLHKFTGWNGPMLTDSGGYQIFSMGHGSVSEEIKGKGGGRPVGWNKTLLRIDETGASFKSYVDGSIHYLTPELSIQIQRKLGADLVVVLDECTPFNVDREYTEQSMHRSHRWADRSLAEFNRSSRDDRKQALYGIVQGGVHRDLREESADFVNSRPFFGSAIGGSLGADRGTMGRVVAYTRSLLREDRPVHLLGIGGVGDIFHGVRQGIDTFDCVHPTRLGRHGGALVKAEYWEREDEHFVSSDISNEGLVEETDMTGVEKGSQEERELRKRNSVAKAKRRQREQQAKALAHRSPRQHINLTKGPFRGDPRPIDSSCQCYTCRNFSRGYIHHLFKSNEMLGPMLVTSHNVHFMNKLMSDIRTGIANDTLDEVEAQYVPENLRHKKIDAAELPNLVL